MKKRILIHLGILLAMLIVAAGLLLGAEKIGKSRKEAFVASLYGGETPYASLSLFLSSGERLTKTAVSDVRSEIASTLETDSLGTGENSVPIAYAAFLSEEAVGERGSCSTNLTLVGGDFFLLHPLSFLSGSALPSSDSGVRYAVIDERAAWALFGATDVVGFLFSVGGETYETVGIVESEKDNPFYGEIPRLFLPYDSYAGEAPLTCIEALLPDPVEGYADSLWEKATSSYSEKGIRANGGRRTSLLSLLGSYSGFFAKPVREKEIAFPYWENDAIVQTEKAALLAGIAAVTAAVALLLLLIAFFRRFSRFRKGVSGFFVGIGSRASDAVDRVRCRKYYRDNKKE